MIAWELFWKEIYTFTLNIADTQHIWMTSFFLVPPILQKGTKALSLALDVFARFSTVIPIDSSALTYY